MYNERETKCKIKEFSLYYKIGDIIIKDYFYKLMEYPFYVPDHEGMFCLEQICQTKIVSIASLKNRNIKKEYKYTTDFAINDAIYATYKEKSVPYLSEEFVEYKGIKREEVKELKLTNM